MDTGKDSERNGVRGDHVPVDRAGDDADYYEPFCSVCGTVRLYHYPAGRYICLRCESSILGEK